MAVITVNSLATQFADRQLAHQQFPGPQRALARKRVEYDFKVTGFNVLTAATIVALAGAIITSSVALLVIWGVLYNMRNAFMNAVEQTALLAPGQQAIDPALVARIANLDSTQRRNEIAAHLEINDRNWKVFQCRILDFKALMSWTPADLPAAPAIQAPRAPEAAVVPPLPAVAAALPEAEEAPPLIEVVVVPAALEPVEPAPHNEVN
jgi:hypothetical protein